MCKNNHGEIVALPKEKFCFRPSVYGIIRHGNMICVCRNKSNGKIWFPGEGMDIGESRVDALRREIKEESGLREVVVGPMLGSFENFFYYQEQDLAMHAFLFFYECHTDETRLFVNSEVEDDEAVDFQWMEKEKITKETLGDLNEEIFNMLTALK